MLKIKQRPLLCLLAILFVLAEIAMGIYVQTGTEQINIVAYCSVALAFVFVLYCFDKSYLWLFTAAALMMTLCADVFLVLLTPRREVLAMVFFNLAQVFYALRLFCKQKTARHQTVHLLLRVVLCAAALVATKLVLKENTNLLALISIVYYANLICNVVWAFIVKDTMFAVGLIFFALCDAFVGLGVLCNMLNVSQTSLLYKLAFPAKVDPVWLFYVPSQTLIALSTLPNKLKSN